MRRLGSKSLPDLLKIFDEENRVKDSWYRESSDTWPRGRFNEANSQFGEWNEYELSYTELLDVKLHWNTEFEIPQEGMTVAEALPLHAVQRWIAKGGDIVYPESHIWLATAPLRNSCVEHRLLKDYEGHLVTLDGIHRLVAWAYGRKETSLAFVAGNIS
jgi:hypothetical protein